MEAGSVVRAVFDFLPSVSEELPLFTGDVIEVLSVVDEFWLLGNKDGVTGTPTVKILLLILIYVTKCILHISMVKRVKKTQCTRNICRKYIIVFIHPFTLRKKGTLLMFSKTKLNMTTVILLEGSAEGKSTKMKHRINVFITGFHSFNI